MSHWTNETFIDHADVFKRRLQDRVEGTDAEVENLLSLLSDHDVDPETALDVCCGIGRHTVELAERGLSVHGIDLSPEYVESARERATRENVGDRVTVDIADMRELGAIEGQYDLVTNLWTSFGYYDDATNEAVAAGFRERLEDDGALVMDISNKEHMLANYTDSSAFEDETKLSIERREYDPETSRIESTLTLFENEDEAYEFLGEVEWDLRIYAPIELRQLLERAGFDAVHLYGGLDGSDLARDANRLVVVAHP